MSREDIIISIYTTSMNQIVSGVKNHEFRKYSLDPNVKRIWFYETEPLSRIRYVIEIGEMKCRKNGDRLEENGLGNKEFNEYHKDWENYDWGYSVKKLYKLSEPIKLEDHGLNPPKRYIYTPETIISKELIEIKLNKNHPDSAFVYDGNWK